MRALAVLAIARRYASGGLARRAARARTTRRPAARPPRPPGRHPFRRRRRTPAGGRSTSPRWRPLASRVRLRSPARRPAASTVSGHLELEAELGVADPHLVEVRSAPPRPSRRRTVEERPVGRVHVLNVVVGPAGVDAGVDPRGETVLDPHVGFGRAADRQPAEQVEALAGLEAPTAWSRPARRRWPRPDPRGRSGGTRSPRARAPSFGAAREGALRATQNRNR